jgi:hypothetical protein
MAIAEEEDWKMMCSILLRVERKEEEKETREGNAF